MYGIKILNEDEVLMWHLKECCRKKFDEVVGNATRFGSMRETMNAYLKDGVLLSSVCLCLAMVSKKI